MTTQQLIDDLGKRRGIPFAESLSKRLVYLLECLKEEVCKGKDYQKPMSLPSLTDFIAFIKLHPDRGCPQVTVSYEGEIHAEWKATDICFSITFVGRHECKIVMLPALDIL